jgi:hypothetical protein
VTARRGQPGQALRPERLPTNSSTHQHAVHRWFSFIAGFSPEFVALCCEGMEPGVLVDPFAGCGTALVVARERGWRSIGFEPHPFFSRIARAKVSPPPSAARLAVLERALLEGVSAPRDGEVLEPGARRFLEKLFDAVTLARLLGARESLREQGLAGDDLAFLSLSRVVDMCSRAQTDGIYKAPTSRKRAAEPEAAIREVLACVRADVERLPSGAGEAVVVEASSESMARVGTGSADVIVTSPPYLNNFDFAEMTRMHLYFWGMCASWREITERVRSRLVVNTTTALAGHRERQEAYRDAIVPSLRPELDAVVRALTGERTRRAGKKEYDLLVYPYFAQLSRVLGECWRCLGPGGKLNLVVADAALYGVHVSTPQYLARLAVEHGFQRVRCELLRARGHRWILAKRDGSPQGLGEYHLSGER